MWSFVVLFLTCVCVYDLFLLLDPTISSWSTDTPLHRVSSPPPSLFTPDHLLVFTDTPFASCLLSPSLSIHTRPYRTVPSSVVKCLWEVFVWGFGALFLFLSYVCVGGVVLCRCVCVCDLLIFLHPTISSWFTDTPLASCLLSVQGKRRQSEDIKKGDVWRRLPCTLFPSLSIHTR